MAVGAVGAVGAYRLSTEDVLFLSRSGRSQLFLNWSYCFWAKGYCCASGQTESCSLTS